jgi:hypothetical protein
MYPEKEKLDPELTLSETDTLNISQETRVEEEASRFTLLFRLPLIKWRTFIVFTIFSFALIFHWFSTSELFTIPEDVKISRSNFYKAKERYLQNTSYWDAKQKHFTEKLSEALSCGNEFEVKQLIQDIPGEVFVSFLLKKLHLGLDRIEKTAVFSRDPQASSSLIISKPETSVWPFSIMLALEVEIKAQKERFSLAVTRLRRGTQDIALSLAWTYFGPELESIRQLESTSKQSFILLSTNEEHL